MCLWCPGSACTGWHTCQLCMQLSASATRAPTSASPTQTLAAHIGGRVSYMRQRVHVAASATRLGVPVAPDGLHKHRVVLDKLPQLVLRLLHLLLHLRYTRFASRDCNWKATATFIVVQGEPQNRAMVGPLRSCSFYDQEAPCMRGSPAHAVLTWAFGLHGGPRCVLIWSQRVCSPRSIYCLLLVRYGQVWTC